jgi:tRNA pseudouridine55 synthase
VVARVRRLAGQRRVGHAGTLDPLATGVLPVMLGRATRLVDVVQQGTKTYRASVRLGEATLTDDAAGEVSARAAVPSLDRAQVTHALAGFVGEIWQTPPAYSAIKVGGERAYARARRGEAVTLPPRQVNIVRVCLLDLEPAALALEVECGSGTYVRSVARDLALALGTVGHLTALVRTRVGPFAQVDAISLDQLADDGPAAHLQSPASSLPDAPTVVLGDDDLARLTNGQALTRPGLRGEAIWVYDAAGDVHALAVADGQVLRTRVLL